MRRWRHQGGISVSEDGKGTERSQPASLGWQTSAWVGGVVFLAFLSIVLIYAYGDPRPSFVEAAKIGGDAPSIPTIAPGEQYYRIRAEYIPLAPARATADPIGQLWASLFGKMVSAAGAASGAAAAVAAAMAASAASPSLPSSSSIVTLRLTAV